MGLDGDTWCLVQNTIDSMQKAPQASLPTCTHLCAPSLPERPVAHLSSLFSPEGQEQSQLEIGFSE